MTEYYLSIKTDGELDEELSSSIKIVELTLQLLSVGKRHSPIRVSKVIHFYVLDKRHVVTLGSGVLVKGHVMELLIRNLGKLGDVVVREKIDGVVCLATFRFHDHI
jgi:hypothetical protein